MITIQHVDPCQVLNAKRVTLDCGHILILEGEWKVGGQRRCEPCIQGEPKIVDIIQHDQVLQLYLSCGDMRPIDVNEQFPTAESAIDLIGTSHPCRGPNCRAAKQRKDKS